MQRTPAGAGRGVRPAALPVVIPVQGRFEGLVSFRGGARVDGELHGEVLAQGTLYLGESARVEANIQVDELIVAGSLAGDVQATRRIELRSTAQVRGELRAPRVSFEDGCHLRGRCRTGTRSEMPRVSASLPRSSA